MSNNRKRKREEILLEEFHFNEFNEDFTDNVSVDGLNDTLNDLENVNFVGLVDDFMYDEETSIFC